MARAYIEPAVVGVMTNGEDGMQHSKLRLLVKGKNNFERDDKVEALMEQLTAYLAPHIRAFAAAHSVDVEVKD